MISADTYNRILVGLTSPAAATEVANQLNNLTETTTDALTALAGGAKAGATPLPSLINRVVTVATAADSCLLPSAVPGLNLTVINANVTNAIAVYGAGTDIINALATTVAFPVAATQVAYFACAVAGKWNVTQVYNLTETVTDAIAALAGGTKAGATPLPSTLNRVVTVATAADSCLLPPAVAGTDLTVINSNVSNAVAVFAQGTTDVINALSAATAFSIAATKSCRFMCVVAGKWNTQLGA
jgi:hypothetical protein